MSSPIKATKATVLAHVQALIAGTNKHFPNGSFTLGNTAYTASSLVALFQSLTDAIGAADTARASAKDALKTLRGMHANVGPVIQAYRRLLLVMFGNAMQTLADFGLEPLKVPRPRTTEQNAVAVAKRDATRKARGTIGKIQKLAIKGNVTSVQVTPITSSEASSPSPPAQAPASNAPQGASK